MELTNEELEVIRSASRDIEFGRITVNITGNPSNIVEIIPEQHIRFQNHRRHTVPEPTTGEPVNQRGSGRVVRK